MLESSKEGIYINEPDLIWKLPHLRFEEYYGGPNKNSTYSYNYNFPVSDVNFVNSFLNKTEPCR